MLAPSYKLCVVTVYTKNGLVLNLEQTLKTNGRTYLLQDRKLR